MLTKTLLILAAVTTIALAGQEMPRFDYSISRKIMLTWDDRWEVGGSNMLAILSKDKKIIIRVKVSGDTGGGMKRMLFYKCPKNSVEESIDLSSLATTSTTDRCSSTISFQVSALKSVDDTDFQLAMGSSKLSYTEVFRERIEFFIKIEYATGELVSNRLFVWSLDAISSFSSASTSTSYKKRFLTDAAVNYMKKTSTATSGFDSIQFLEPAISRVLKEAPDFFKAKMNLGSILYFDAGSCLTFQMGKSIMFVNYNSKLDDDNQNFQKLMKLNIDDGKLWYSACGLRNEVKRFYDEKKPATSIGICSIVSFSGEVEPYQNTEAVEQRVPISDTSYSTCVSSDKACEVVPGISPNVTILSGMDFTAIVCPIICNDKTEVFRFYRNDVQMVGSGDEWTYVDGLRISRTGNIVEFPHTLSNRHSGVYRCEAGSKSFSFKVKVISLPQFQTETFVSDSHAKITGLLPPKVYAIEDEYVSYSCIVNFASLETVKIEPVFYFVETVGGSQSWTKMTLDEFRSKVNTDGADFFLNATSAGKDSKRLTATVRRVPPVYTTYGTNFSHRFVCDVSIDRSESMMVGMPTYKVQSGGDVVFIPRLTRKQFVLNPNNNCSVQGCGFSKGAFFEFSLTDEFMAYLTRVGVDVESYLRLDNDLLDNVKILFNNASEISTTNAPQRLAYKIYPVSSPDVAKELVKRKRLIPVYNFRYRTGSNIANLKLDKERHGEPIAALGQSDCRQDSLCFYSTDFDIGSSLSFLPVSLNFKMPTEPEPAAANSIIIGVVIGIICLIVVIILIVYWVRRQPERAYLVEEKEIQLGHNPKEEAKAEVFKEYQRVPNQAGDEDGAAVVPLQGNRMSLGSSLSVASGDDKELDQYKDDIDFKEFGEQGSFIGGYQNDPRKKEVFEAAGGNEASV
uniref:Bravo_FIGEY domain-containing protein n=1 Tax=Macrostomum lignano TaxID=282301 RepID=A0A1I8GDY1_9PLAT